MRVTLGAMGSIAGLLFIAQCSSAQAKLPIPPGKPAAIVNGEAIPGDQVAALLNQRPSPVPLTEGQKREMRKGALDMLINDLLMRQFLRTNALPASQAEIAAEINSLHGVLKKQKSSLQEFLSKSKQTEKQLRADIAARIQWRKYIQSRLPETMLMKYYHENKIFFDKVFVRASHILIRLGENATPAERETATAKLRQIRDDVLASKISFADAAKAHSDCPSKEKGGDIGMFPYKFVVVEPFAKAAFALQVGQMSDVVRTPFGVHLIKVTGRTPAQPSKYEDIKETVREVYAQEHDLYQRTLLEQRKKADIQVFMR